jgi:hypothetical protein
MKLLILLLLPIFSIAQNNSDNKIIITVSDTTNLHERVRLALVRTDFMVKDDGYLNKLTTYPRELKKIPGFAVAKADVSGNTITLYGSYGLKKINDWGYTDSPKKYQPIIYYKGSKTWRLLMDVAEKLDGTISYAK